VIKDCITYNSFGKISEKKVLFIAIKLLVVIVLVHNIALLFLKEILKQSKVGFL
jgi:hypothetical protein